MMSLLNNEQLSELTGKIYDASLDPRLWQHFLSAFDNAVTRITCPPGYSLPGHGETISICRPSGKMPYQLMVTPLNHRSTEVALYEGGAKRLII